MNTHRKFTKEIQRANKHENSQSSSSERKCKLKKKEPLFATHRLANINAIQCEPRQGKMGTYILLGVEA